MTRENAFTAGAARSAVLPSSERDREAGEQLVQHV
jgi:hypothetical protein